MNAEITALLEKQTGAIAELKTTVDDRIKLGTKGIVDGLLEEKMKKINNALDGVTAKYNEIKQLEAQFLRQSTHDEKGKVIPADAAGLREAFTKFIREGEGGNAEGVWSKKYCKALATAIETKSMSIISDADGGYSVLPDFSGKMVSKIWETSPVRKVADVVQVGGPSISGLYDNDQVSSGWVSETGARNPTNTAKLGRWMVGIYTQYAEPVATQDLLDDADFDIEAYLINKGGDKLARTENLAFVAGNGVGQPRGFTTYAAGTNIPLNGVAGQIQQIHSGNATTLTYQGLNNLQYALKDQYRSRAQWAMPRNAIGVIRGLVDSFGRPLWGEANLTTGQPASLLGYAVNEFNDMASVGAGSLSVCLADWSQFYSVFDRKGIRILRDPYTSKGNVLFYMTKRVGGDVLNFEAGALQVTAA